MRLRWLPGLAVVLCASCATPPYAHREHKIEAGRYATVRHEAVDDLQVLGQFDVDGRMAGRVSSAQFTFDTDYLDQAEEARSICPLAYHDLAHVSLLTDRYLDAVRCAKRSIESGGSFYDGAAWTMLRLVNLHDNHRLLYESYLALGDLDRAAAHYHQYLLLSELLQSRAFKTLCANAIRLRMTSIRLHADYLTHRSWVNLQESLIILVAIAGAAAGAQNNNSNHQNNNTALALQCAALGTAMVALMESYKRQLQVEHGIELHQLMSEAERLNGLTPPSADDLRRAKLASRIFAGASARDPVSAFDRADLGDLARDLQAAVPPTLSPDRDGRLHVSGDLKTFAALMRKVDEVPLRLPPPDPGQLDDYLDHYLTPDLYRMAGLRISASEQALLSQWADSEVDPVIDPASPRGQALLSALRRMMQKANAFETWAAAL